MKKYTLALIAWILFFLPAFTISSSTIENTKTISCPEWESNSLERLWKLSNFLKLRWEVLIVKRYIKQEEWRKIGLAVHQDLIQWLDEYITYCSGSKNSSVKPSISNFRDAVNEIKLYLQIITTIGRLDTISLWKKAYYEEIELLWNHITWNSFDLPTDDSVSIRDLYSTWNIGFQEDLNESVSIDFSTATNNFWTPWKYNATVNYTPYESIGGSKHIAVPVHFDVQYKAESGSRKVKITNINARFLLHWIWVNDPIYKKMQGIISSLEAVENVRLSQDEIYDLGNEYRSNFLEKVFSATKIDPLEKVWLTDLLIAIWNKDKTIWLAINPSICLRRAELFGRSTDRSIKKCISEFWQPIFTKTSNEWIFLLHSNKNDYMLELTNQWSKFIQGITGNKTESWVIFLKRNKDWISKYDSDVVGSIVQNYSGLFLIELISINDFLVWWDWSLKFDSGNSRFNLNLTLQNSSVWSESHSELFYQFSGEKSNSVNVFSYSFNFSHQGEDEWTSIIKTIQLSHFISVANINN